MSFWTLVKSYGHNDEEIVEELTKLKNRESWVQFKNLPQQLINKQLIEAELLEGKNNKTKETKMCQTFKDVSLYKK